MITESYTPSNHTFKQNRIFTFKFIARASVSLSLFSSFYQFTHLTTKNGEIFALQFLFKALDQWIIYEILDSVQMLNRMSQQTDDGKKAKRIYSYDSTLCTVDSIERNF